jgi:hypothetical protein
MMPSRIELPGGRGSDLRAAAFWRAQPAVAGPPFIDRAAARSDPEPAGRDVLIARALEQACVISTPLVIRHTERAPRCRWSSQAQIGTAVDGLSDGNPAVVPGLGVSAAYLAEALAPCRGAGLIGWWARTVISHGMVVWRSAARAPRLA